MLSEMGGYILSKSFPLNKRGTQYNEYKRGRTLIPQTKGYCTGKPKHKWIEMAAIK